MYAIRSYYAIPGNAESTTLSEHRRLRAAVILCGVALALLLCGGLLVGAGLRDLLRLAVVFVLAGLPAWYAVSGLLLRLGPDCRPDAVRHVSCLHGGVITSYSIHYTKLYDIFRLTCAGCC